MMKKKVIHISHDECLTDSDGQQDNILLLDQQLNFCLTFQFLSFQDGGLPYSS